MKNAIFVDAVEGKAVVDVDSISAVFEQQTELVVSDRVVLAQISLANGWLIQSVESYHDILDRIKKVYESYI